MNSNQSQERPGENGKTPNRHRRELDRSPEDAEASHPNQDRLQWQKRKKEEECVWHYGHERATRNHAAKIPLQAKKKKMAAGCHGDHRAQNEEHVDPCYGERDHGLPLALEP